MLSSSRRIDTTLGDPAVVNAFYKPHTIWSKPELSWCRLPDKYNVDVDQLLGEALLIQERFGFEQFEIGNGKKKFSYRGIGLTARPNVDRPLYDALRVLDDNNQPVSINDVIHSSSERNPHRKLIPINEKFFNETTPAMTPVFQQVLSKFQSPWQKVRLIELKPGGVLASHVDYPYYKGIRLHCMLRTNPDVVWEIEGHRFHIPANGSFYWCDVGRYHSVVNNGNQSRLVLSVNLSVYFDRDGQPRHDPNRPLSDIISSGEL